VVHELGYDLGMCCGGRMEVFVEPVEGSPRLLLCGAGHVSKATAALAQTVGFRVSVIDDREELNSAARFPGCQRELLDPAEMLRRSNVAEHDWVVIATHDHQLDEQALEQAIRRGPRYVGLVGSRRKVFRFLARMAAKHPELPLDRVYGPIGLDLGAIGPEEIAVSIVAELVALRRGALPRHLSAVEQWRQYQAGQSALTVGANSAPSTSDEPMASGRAGRPT
jgi:xanthine dehydrogenase accessory factor